MNSKLKLKKIDNLYLALNKPLGRGSYGDVLLGYYPLIKEFVAVKLIEKSRISDSKYLESEIINMKKALHQNIVQLIDCKYSKNYVYLIEEYCNNGSLEAYLNEKTRLSEKESLYILKNIILGYKHLYENNIVHRDLKPGNILFNNSDVKICDFGFSKLWDNDHYLISRVGTTLYMSPQILEGDKYTNKTDIWSLGIIFYHLLFGKNPWIDDKKEISPIDLLKTIKQKNLEFPKNIYVSNKSKNLIKGMLMYDEEDRDSWENMFNENTFYSNVKDNNDDFLLFNENSQEKKVIKNIEFEINNEKNKKIEIFPELIDLKLNNKSSENLSSSNFSKDDDEIFKKIFNDKCFAENERKIFRKIEKYFVQKRNKIFFFAYLSSLKIENLDFISLFSNYCISNFKKISYNLKNNYYIPKNYVCNNEEWLIFKKSNYSEKINNFIENSFEKIRFLEKKSDIIYDKKKIWSILKEKIIDYMKKHIKMLQQLLLNIDRNILEILIAFALVYKVKEKFKNKRIFNLDFDILYEELKEKNIEKLILNIEEIIN